MFFKSLILAFLKFLYLGDESTIGVGVYILVGTIAREHAKPVLLVSILKAGIE